MFMDPKEMLNSVDCWANGAKSELFNMAATSTPTVNMAPANDTQPGILGFNR